MDTEQNDLIIGTLARTRAWCGQGDFATAVQELLGAIDRWPNEPRLLHYLGVTLTGNGDYDGARVALQAAASLVERVPPADRIAILKSALAMNPDDATNLHNLSAALAACDRLDEALEIYAMRTKPWDGRPCPTDIAGKYSLLAPDYDDNNLHASFSLRLLAFVEKAAPDHAPATILDLGCGSGQLARHLPPSVQRLTGIDASSAMLALAEARGRYFRLLHGDLVEVMAGLTEQFDAIYSCCVLYHLSDLAPVFAAASRRLAPGGLFAFSVDPSPEGQDVGESGPGEYCHSRSYLRRCAQAAGLDTLMIAAGVHRATPGFYGAFAKPLEN